MKNFHPGFLTPRHPPKSANIAAWKLMMAVAALLFLWFGAYPKSDLLFSALFFERSFYGRSGMIPGLVYDSVYLMLVSAITLILFYFWQSLRRKADWRVPTFLFGVLMLGPGLLVNAILKETWGRARPDDVTHFGGDAIFTAPWLISDQCATNCSFVSGHASMAFFFVALAFIWSGSTRTFWRLFATGWLIGLVMGFVRVYQGRHFLSDVLWAGVLVSAVALALHWLLFVMGTTRQPK